MKLSVNRENRKWVYLPIKRDEEDEEDEEEERRRRRVGCEVKRSGWSRKRTMKSGKFLEEGGGEKEELQENKGKEMW